MYATKVRDDLTPMSVTVKIRKRTRAIDVGRPYAY